ncbi:hypothetical protein [Lentilactobacillus kosonis]|uniref:Uncharacterized protein n=1 Tax=Lentilactobacillus kosonis TaxID=2810561 RepID=A0A401FPJ2_9LACO|nr:hypothetical protein [Lentilactobacillus kosonis]GAY74257.1 hypothetical protein NBRC111893_2403 [Lentilactobacillus kosonis]
MPLVTNKRLQGITTVDGTSINLGMDVINSSTLTSDKYEAYSVSDNFLIT